MLTPVSYNKLLPFKEPIAFYVNYGQYVGFDIHQLRDIYKEVSDERIDIGCSGCRDTWFRRIYDLINEYELIKNI